MPGSLCVCKILKDEQCVHDIVQEAFISLWKNRETLPSELHLKMFLYQIVRHRCLGLKRQEKEALKRTPDKRFRFFLRLIAELGKFQLGHKEEKNNFILVRKR